MSFIDENAIARVATVEGIDATGVATTALYTVPAGKTFIPLLVVIRITAFTVGSKSTQVVASFGGNASTYDDWLNSITYTVATVDTFQKDAPDDATELPVQAAGDAFTLSIETGSDADVETWAVDVYGALVDA